MKHLIATGNKSVIHTLQKVNRSVDPEVGELTNYSMTYGTHFLNALSSNNKS